MRADGRSTGAVALWAGGMASAFSAAACCGLPVLLAGAGIGTAWLLPLARIAGPHADWLSLLALALLLASFVLVVRRPKQCAAGALCARPAFRVGMLAALAGGAGLLAVAIP
jgi:mercuric ion transport protein